MLSSESLPLWFAWDFRFPRICKLGDFFLHNLRFSYSLSFFYRFSMLSNVHQLYRMSISRIPYSSQLGSMFSQIACDLILPQFQNLFIRLLGNKTLFRIHPSPSTRLFTTSPSPQIRQLVGFEYVPQIILKLDVLKFKVLPIAENFLSSPSISDWKLLLVLTWLIV